jgi:Skp family chaperone for outer membrane proteins
VTPQGVPIKLAYIDISALLDEVFLPVTQALEVKQRDLRDLRAHYDQGQIDQRTYQQELLNLEVELLSVPLYWDLSLIQKMISSPEFSDLRATLVELGEKVQPLERELQALRHSAVQEVEDLQDFLFRYKQLQSLFEQLHQLLSQTVASVLTKVTQEIARAQGYALVLRKGGALDLDESQLEDLARLVKSRLPELFSP